MIVGSKLKCDKSKELKIRWKLYVINAIYWNCVESSTPNAVSDVEAVTDGTTSILAYSIKSLDMLMLHIEKTNSSCKYSV